MAAAIRRWGTRVAVSWQSVAWHEFAPAASSQRATSWRDVPFAASRRAASHFSQRSWHAEPQRTKAVSTSSSRGARSFSGIAGAPSQAGSTADIAEAFFRDLQPARFVEDLNARHPVFMLSKDRCPFCKRAKALLEELGASFEVIELDDFPEEAKATLQAHLKAVTGAGSVPRVYVSGVCLGGFNETQRSLWAGDLVPALVAAGAASEKVGRKMHFDAGNPFL